MSPEKARRESRLDLGGTEQTKETCRETAGLPWLERLARDLRYSFRSLRRSPGFTLVTLATLGIAIGANASVFSLINALVFEPLPYPDSDQLVYFGRPPGKFGVSAPNLLDWQNQQSTFVDIAGMAYAGYNLTGSGVPLRVTCCKVTPGFFSILGAKPLIGRTLPSSEHGPTELVVLSYETWQNGFGGDSSVVGEFVLIDDVPHEVVGVMQKGFGFPWRGDIWKPLDLNKERIYKRRTASILRAYGRLMPGTSIRQAQAEIDLISQRLAEQYPEAKEDITVRLVPLEPSLGGPLMILLAAVGSVLLLACINLMNLLLARGAKREREQAIRKALGSGRLRLIRSSLCESLLLAAGGGALGLLFAFWMIPFVVHWYPESMSRIQDTQVDWTVLAFVFVLTAVVTILFGLIPSLVNSRTDVNLTLKGGDLRTTESAASRRLRSGLIITQVALAFLLVIGSGLLLKSYWGLTHFNLGFEIDDRLTAKFALSRDRYKTDDQKIALYREVLRRLSSLRGVESVGMTSNLTFSDSSYVVTFPKVEGSLEGEKPYVHLEVVSPGFFETMGIRLFEGRVFSDRDLAGSDEVTILDRKLAQQLYPSGGAVGNRFELEGKWRTVVGVVESVQRGGPKSGQAPTKLYMPFEQHPVEYLACVLKTAIDPHLLSSSVREVFRDIDPDQPIYAVRTMEEHFRRSISNDEFYTLLLSCFGLVALALAVLGIYGVVAFQTARRTHEVGIRAAVGASRADIFGLIVRQGMLRVCAGVIIGCLGALALTRWLSSMLFEVDPLDPATFLIVAAIFLAVGFVACALPAQRAARLDPYVALRYE